MIADSGFNVFSDNLWLLIKFGLLAFCSLYFIFSLIVVRQIALMTQTVFTQNATTLKLFSYIHALLVLAIIISFILLL